MPHWWNGRHVSFRNSYRKVCRFESYMGHYERIYIMKRLVIKYKGTDLKIKSSRNNTCISDSYKVKNIESMQDLLYLIRGEIKDKKAAIHKRGIWSMTHEWRAHNLLYSLGIKRDRTKDVDLDVNQPWYIKVAYSVLSIFYPHF